MKKVLALLIALVMVLVLVPAVIADEPTVTPIKTVREKIAGGETGVNYTVQGTVTYVYNNKEIYLQDAEGYGICLYLSEKNTDVTVGSVITGSGDSMVYGSLLPELGSGIVTKVEAGTPIVPAKVTFAELTANPAKYLCTLVSFVADITAYDSYSNPTFTDGEVSFPGYRVTLDTEALPIGTKVEANLVYSAYNSYQFRGQPEWVTEYVAPPLDIVVLYTNDVHTSIDNYAKLETVKKGVQETTPYIALVDAGDYLQGTSYGILSEGKIIVDIMNKVGYDVTTLGNHEFDYGMDRLFELTEMMDAKVVSSNFVKLADNKSVYDGYTIMDFGGVKVAFVGITTPEAITKSTPAFFMDPAQENFLYGFNADNLVATVQAAVDAAKAEGAQYVIALGHLGVDNQSSPWMSTEIIAATNGIDAFIDGHSHTTMATKTVANKDGKEIVLTQTGEKLNNVGKLVIKADGTITTELIPTKDVAADEVVAAYIAEQKAPYEAMLAEVVAKSAFGLYVYNPETGKRIIRNSESNLGDLCADAYRIGLDGDVAFVNGGGIRADIKAGDITINQLLAVHPYGNSGCVIEATGQEILDALELGSMSYPGESGGFMQVSGLTYEIHAYKPTNAVVDSSKLWTGVVKEGAENYRVMNVKILNKETGKYEPIDLAKTYKVAGHEYMLQQSGDGYTMFANNKKLSAPGLVDYQIVQKYIVENMKGVVEDQYKEVFGQGRIKIVESAVDTKALEDAIKYAEEFIASKEFDSCSDKLQKMWTDAVASAKAVLADQNHTQAQVDAQVTAIYLLKKTGESTLVFAFAGVGILALAAVAYVVIRRRKFN